MCRSLGPRGCVASSSPPCRRISRWSHCWPRPVWQSSPSRSRGKRTRYDRRRQHLDLYLDLDYNTRQNSYNTTTTTNTATFNITYSFKHPIVHLLSLSPPFPLSLAGPQRQHPQARDQGRHRVRHHGAAEVPPGHRHSARRSHGRSLPRSTRAQPVHTCPKKNMHAPPSIKKTYMPT